MTKSKRTKQKKKTVQFNSHTKHFNDSLRTEGIKFPINHQNKRNPSTKQNQHKNKNSIRLQKNKNRIS